jgi:hypothetical protein
MKNKKLLFFVILLFPALFKIILEFTTINSRKLPYFGPKALAGSDTVYYTATDRFKKATGDSILAEIQLDTANYPLFAVCFIKQAYKKDNYRLAGLSEYAQYKKEKIKHIPFIIVTPYNGGADSSGFGELSKLQEGNKDILPLCWPQASFDSLNQVFFKGKPVYIDYSYFVLVDKNRHIRGYYDARYVSEIKRLTEEYQHMRLKEEKAKVIKINQIESK